MPKMALKCHFKMKWLVLFFTFVADALKIENVIFEEYSMYGATVTMVCEYKVGESEYVDSISGIRTTVNSTELCLIPQ